MLNDKLIFISPSGLLFLWRGTPQKNCQLNMGKGSCENCRGRGWCWDCCLGNNWMLFSNSSLIFRAGLGSVGPRPVLKIRLLKLTCLIIHELWWSTIWDHSVKVVPIILIDVQWDIKLWGHTWKYRKSSFSELIVQWHIDLIPQQWISCQFLFSIY